MDAATAGRPEREVLVAHAGVLVAGVLFGSTFVVVKDAIVDVSPFAFLSVRFLVGAIAMVPALHGRERRAGSVRAGLVCGLALGVGYVFQTVGLQYTTASVSAFVTYLLVVLVPLIGALVLRQRPSRLVLAGVAVATAGLVLLTGSGAGFHKGEALTLVCAVSFAIHVLLLSEFAPRVDPFWLNAVQLVVVGGGCFVPGLAMGGYGFPLRAWLAAVYTGVAVSALALGLQVWGQRRIGPTRASLLLMIEPVSAAVLGWALGERLGAGGAVGAGLILAGIALAEVPLGRSRLLDRAVNKDNTWPDLTPASERPAEKEPYG